MNFFQHQDNARKRTRLLVLYYVMALFALALMFYALVVFIISMVDNSYAAQLRDVNYFDPLLFLATSCGVVLVIGGASALKSLELAGGGGDAVAQQLGGKLLTSASTRDFKERQLLNIVEEMAIAAGINVPNVYLLDHEATINAFAAGFTPNTAAIGVTRGSLEYLNRDELQGVIAHEFSHILNGDMRINIRMISILFGLNLLLIIGWMIFRIAGESSRYRAISSRSDNNNSGGGVMLVLFVLGLGFVIIGVLGTFLSSLIQAAISRQREYLADASAVQFTRNPDGIAGALKKIGCPNVSSRIRSPNAGEASHMFIANIFGRSSFAELMATHPTLAERIHRIDPNFNGVFPTSLQRVDSAQEVQKEEAKKAKQPFNFGILGENGPLGNVLPSQSGGPNAAVGTVIGASLLDAGNAAPVPVAMKVPPKVAEQVGAMQSGKVTVADSLLHAIPDPIRQLAREPLGARAIICAVLLDPRADIRDKQLAILAEKLDQPTRDLTLKINSQLAAFPPESRITLVQIALPALRQLSAAQYRPFRLLVEDLVAADAEVDLFEYTLRGLLLNDLDIHFGMIKASGAQYFSLNAAKAPLVTVLSLLAHAGHESEAEVGKAFKAGLSEFGTSGFILPKSSCTLAAFDVALKRLALFSPQIKERLIRSFCACLLADNVITPKEGELLRAIAANLNCPLPPLERLHR